ncbi:hypothetical protein CLV59_101204 [Chitinophaga dinghuensis]|uniref:Uncharacterized protein n=1 Tax=Chitinophaga dinghuensis TaxID=1539050 RepID=A0A327WA67_9BACT|nr:hypothetical protein CLV59_101204 [Chitinophaga dinghuensis]
MPGRQIYTNLLQKTKNFFPFFKNISKKKGLLSRSSPWNNQSKKSAHDHLLQRQTTTDTAQ